MLLAYRSSSSISSMQLIILGPKRMGHEGEAVGLIDLVEDPTPVADALQVDQSAIRDPAEEARSTQAVPREPGSSRTGPLPLTRNYGDASITMAT